MNNCLPRKPVVGLACNEPTKTQTHLVKFADINYMIERACAGDSSVYRHGSFLDVSDSPDSLQDFLNVQRRAIESYESLPDSVRRRYTSPESFYAAANDSTQRDEFARLGLIINREPDKAIRVEVVTPNGGKASTPPPVLSAT